MSLPLSACKDRISFRLFWLAIVCDLEFEGSRHDIASMISRSWTVVSPFFITNKISKCSKIWPRLSRVIKGRSSVADMIQTSCKGLKPHTEDFNYNMWEFLTRCMWRNYGRKLSKCRLKSSRCGKFSPAVKTNLPELVNCLKFLLTFAFSYNTHTTPETSHTHCC